MRSCITAYVLFLTAGVMVACAPQLPKSVAFEKVDQIESKLQRGVSTRADVQRLLGDPNGQGATFLPTAKEPHNVWYYEDIATVGMRNEPGGVIGVDLRQQILLVFFKGETFDGFMWFTNAQKVKGEEVQTKP